MYRSWILLLLLPLSLVNIVLICQLQINSCHNLKRQIIVHAERRTILDFCLDVMMHMRRKGD